MQAVGVLVAEAIRTIVAALLRRKRPVKRPIKKK
jgi:hypothetical protein